MPGRGCTGGTGSSRIFPPATHYGTDKVLLCAVLLNFPVGFKDLQQLCATLVHEKQGFQVPKPWCTGWLCSPHELTGVSSTPVMRVWEDSLAPVRNNSDHNRKRNTRHSFKLLGSSSTFQLQKNSNSSFKVSAPSLYALYI